MILAQAAAIILVSTLAGLTATFVLIVLPGLAWAKHAQRRDDREQARHRGEFESTATTWLCYGEHHVTGCKCGERAA